MNEDLLSKCRACSNQVSREAEKCPNCNVKYPSLSEEENQRYYSNCFSCGERLLINNYWWGTSTRGKIESGNRVGFCPKCGQPNPIRVPPVPFPPIPIKGPYDWIFRIPLGFQILCIIIISFVVINLYNC